MIFGHVVHVLVVHGWELFVQRYDCIKTCTVWPANARVICPTAGALHGLLCFS